jgi:threonine dehydrogenase-like Zn-dependent dehydrogenase
MLAVSLNDGVVTVAEAPRPSRPHGHALLHLRMAGICNTDLELQRGYYGFSGVPGHEFVADVVEADTAELVGRRVVGEINLECGECSWCRRGLGRHCPHRTTLGIAGWPGAFQEYFTLPERNLHLVPDSVSDEDAVFAEPVAAACEILDQVEIPLAEPVAVLGDGKLGLLVALVLAGHGCRVELFGHHEAKLALTAPAGVIRHLNEEGAPASFDFVVEATGSAEGLMQAVRMTRPRGTVILKSTVHGSVALDAAPIVVNEITLVGSRCGRFAAAMPLLSAHAIPLAGMVSARYPLAQAAHAFEHAARRGTLKVLLLP